MNPGSATDSHRSAVHPIVGWSAAIVPVVLGAVLAWAWTYDGPETPAPYAGGTFVRHFIHYGLFKGYAAGSPTNEVNSTLPVELLEPGDLIICGNPGAVYGDWSHATIYLGDHTVLTQDLLSGIGIGQIEGLGWYDHIRVIRPHAPAATRTAAAHRASHYVGQIFNLMSHPRDPWQWTCSRCVEDAYRTQGVDISDGRFWITPDALVLGAGETIWKR